MPAANDKDHNTTPATPTFYDGDRVRIAWNDPKLRNTDGTVFGPVDHGTDGIPKYLVRPDGYPYSLRWLPAGSLHHLDGGAR